jgi:hypothetical protein
LETPVLCRTSLFSTVHSKLYILDSRQHITRFSRKPNRINDSNDFATNKMHRYVLNTQRVNFAVFMRVCLILVMGFRESRIHRKPENQPSNFEMKSFIILIYFSASLSIVSFRNNLSLKVQTKVRQWLTISPEILKIYER